MTDQDSAVLMRHHLSIECRKLTALYGVHTSKDKFLSLILKMYYVVGCF